MMARTAAARSVAVVVVVSSLFVLSLARRTVDQLPGQAEGSASSLQALASPTLLPLPRGESDPSVADQDPDERPNLEAAKPLAAAAEEDDDATALAVPDHRPSEADRRDRRSFLSCLLGGCGKEEIEAPRRGGGGGGDAAALPAAAAAAAEEEEEAERAVAGEEANRSSAEVMGWIPKEEDGAKGKEGERAEKKRGKKPRDSHSDSDSDSDSNSDSNSDSDSDSDDEEEEDEAEGEGKRRRRKKTKKGKGGFLKWFWRLINRFQPPQA